MPSMRFIFTCCGFLLAANPAQAYQYCGNLPKNSSAYYSCEALNQQERFEQDRKREREIRDAQERSRYEQERGERAEFMQSREMQERLHMQAELLELLPITDGIKTAVTALDAKKCDLAQRVLDDIQPKIENTHSSYSLDGKIVTRQDLENGFVAIQLKVYAICLTTAQQNTKLFGYLKKEVSKGNKVAMEFLAEVRKGTGRKNGRNINVPKFSDYGTDMASIVKYGADLYETLIDACREAWAKNKDADAAYCVARYESRDSEVAFSSENAKSLTMLREAAKRGHPIAQNNLAMELEHSKPPANSADIVKLIKASAKKGIPHAQVTVGWWHMTGGHGFKIDYAKAMNWNLVAYKQGHSEGANNIGEIYEKGLGVSKDMEQAKSWYKKASVLGNAEATERLKKLAR